MSERRWTAEGTRATNQGGTEVVTLSWSQGELQGPVELVAEWRRLCNHYAGGRFFVGSGQPLHLSDDPATDPVASFLIASQWLPVRIDEVTWIDAPPPELAGCGGEMFATVDANTGEALEGGGGCSSRVGGVGT